MFGDLNYITYTKRVYRFETSKSHPVPNIVYFKLATLASYVHDTELTCFKRRSQFTVYKTN
jgi:hypothetical protein